MENNNTQHTELKQYMQDQKELVSIALSIMSGSSRTNWFIPLLKKLLEITRCEFGFIGLIRNTNKSQNLQLCALYDSNWPEEKKHLFENTLGESLIINEYEKLLGNSLKTEQLKLLNLANEPIIDNFKTIPILHDNKTIALIGVGDRKMTLDDSEIKRLSSLNDLIYLIIQLIPYKRSNLDKVDVDESSLKIQAIPSEQLIQDLKLALSQNQLHIAYQPQVHMTTKIITGFEALLRWKHPTQGEIPPSLFIPLAEKANLAESINLYVLKKAISDFNNLFKQEDYPLKLSINVSPHVKDLATHCQALNEIIKKESTVYKSIKLELEITEKDISNSGEDMENLSCLLRSMKKSHVSIAVDNFGLKKTSLDRLLNHNFNVLKINNQFTHALDSKNTLEAKNIISVILDIAKRLNFDVIAEGVETQQQADILQSLGCAKAQGFYYYYPMPIEEVYKLLQAQKL